ncbi:conserved Plasmodium protein [uncultured Mediterranean phage uvMED]|nr:conserved Plasmodium protein [uncultured Mediterranean phage uvMED]
MEVEYQGMKFKGGKFFIIISLIGAIIGGGWTGYKFYDDYLDMKAKIESYTAPDLSNYDEQIAVLKSEVSMILEEVSLINDVVQSQKNDLRDDIKTVKQDTRLQDRIIKDVETMVKDMDRQLHQDLKLLEEKLESDIRKALNNPLSGVK